MRFPPRCSCRTQVSSPVCVRMQGLCVVVHLCRTQVRGTAHVGNCVLFMVRLLEHGEDADGCVQSDMLVPYVHEHTIC